MSATLTTSQRRRHAEPSTTPLQSEGPLVRKGLTDPIRAILWPLGVLVSAGLGSLGTASLMGLLGVLLTLWVSQGNQHQVLALTILAFTLLGALASALPWWAAALAWCVRELRSTTTISEKGIVSTGFTGVQTSVPDALYLRGVPLLGTRLVTDTRRLCHWPPGPGSFAAATDQATRIASALGVPLIDQRDTETWERFTSDPEFRTVYTLRQRAVKHVKAKPAKHTIDHAGQDIAVRSGELFAPDRRVRITNTHLIRNGTRIPLADISAAAVVRAENRKTATLNIVVGDEVVPVLSVTLPVGNSPLGEAVWAAQRIEEAAANAKRPVGDHGDVPAKLEDLLATRNVSCPLGEP